MMRAFLITVAVLVCFFTAVAFAQEPPRTVNGQWAQQRGDLGARVLGAAATVEGSQSCVCEIVPFAGVCKMPRLLPNLPPQDFIYGTTCGAPPDARVLRSTYLSDSMGRVRSIIMEWK